MASPEIKNLHLELSQYMTRLKVGAGFVLVLALILMFRLVYLPIPI